MEASLMKLTLVIRVNGLIPTFLKSVRVLRYHVASGFAFVNGFPSS